MTVRLRLQSLDGLACTSTVPPLPSRTPRFGFGQSEESACRYNRNMADKLTIAGREFSSRLIVGTGKYRSFQEMMRCHEASGADMVTVAVRRVNLTDRTK